ncbi:putative ribonuclease H-like domain-containing protein [Tanacetum coccineum]
MSNEFETLMHDKFQMSSMGELSFFLELQVKQKSDGIFISQDKYVAEILQKFDFALVKTASTPMETNKAWVKDEEAEDVDVHLYRLMIGSLMYLTASRPDIMFAVCACAWFQVTPKTSHFNVVKRIFRYLKGQPKLGLWYPRYSPFELEAFFDSDYAGASFDRKFITRGWVHAITDTIDVRDMIITEASIRRHLKLQDSEGLSSLPNAEIFKQLTHMGFIQILLNKEQRLLLPHTKTYSTPTLINKLFNNMRRASKGYSRVVTPLFDTMLVQPQGEAPSTSPSRITSSPSLSSHHTPPSTPNTPPSFQTTHEAEETATMPHDLPLQGGHTPGNLKQTKKTYSTTFTKLVLKVKKLEKQVRSGKARRRARIVLSEDEDAAEDPSKQGRKIAQIDTDPTISLVQDEGTSWFQEDVETQEKNSANTEVLLEEETLTELIEDLGSGEKGEKEISTADVPVSTAGAKVSTASHDVSTAAAALVYIRRSASKDKGKAIMQEPEPPKKLKKRVQVQMSVDEELARKVQEEEQAKAMAEQEQERINFEAALELQRQFNEKEEVPAEATQS